MIHMFLFLVKSVYISPSHIFPNINNLDLKLQKYGKVIQDNLDLKLYKYGIVIQDSLDLSL